ncbi:MAG: PA2817 family protein [Oceanicoccus sp.]
MPSSNPLNYFQHHKALLLALFQHCQMQLPFADDRASDIDIEFIDRLQMLAFTEEPSDDFQQQGQYLLTQIVTHYPHITPAVNRDLFWFFGGECLHYMGDDELALYQQLDEVLNEDLSLGYLGAKSKVFKLH